MRILFLTQIVPYPPTAGPKIKTWHVLRYLAAGGHEIILASFVRPEEEKYIPDLKRVCSQFYRVPIRRSRWIDGVSWLRSHLTGRPFLVERDDLSEMRKLVARLLQEQSIDAIHADQLTMAQYALSFRQNGKQRPLIVFDAHNATWTIVERMRQTLPKHMRILQPLLTLEAHRVKRYEGMIVQKFDHTLAVTEIDRCDLLQARNYYEKAKGRANNSAIEEAGEQNPRILVIPIAVDTSEHQPLVRQPGSMNIVTLGSLNYPPNADGVRWFAREIFPRIKSQIPAVSLAIIGKNPPQDLIELGARNPEKIAVTGFVPDIKPYLEHCALVVVPVRAGSGMRVRILEMFALGMPVVTTTIGLEGIEAEPGKDVLVADSPDEFAAAVVRLMQDENMQGRLALNGRCLANQRYDWRAALNLLTDIYKDSA